METGEGRGGWMDPPARFRIDGSSLFLFSLGIDCPVCAFFEMLLRVFGTVRFGFASDFFPLVFLYEVIDGFSFRLTGEAIGSHGVE